MNFDPSQNKRFKCFFFMKPKHKYRAKYPFVLFCHEKNLDCCHERSSYHFEKELWSSTKQRVQMIFSRKKSINIVYPNANYHVLLVHHEKNLDSYHKRSLSHFMEELWSSKNEGFKYFFHETNASISCIQMLTTHLSWSVMKKPRFLPRTNLVPF